LGCDLNNSLTTSFFGASLLRAPETFFSSLIGAETIAGSSFLVYCITPGVGGCAFTSSTFLELINSPVAELVNELAVDTGAGGCAFTSSAFLELIISPVADLVNALGCARGLGGSTCYGLLTGTEDTNGEGFSSGLLDVAALPDLIQPESPPVFAGGPISR
jgi:hypothetical protein